MPSRTALQIAMRSLFATVVAVGVLVPTPANASDGFHRYSYAVENNAGPYVGLLTQRYDQFSQISPDGCLDHYSGHPIYQTQWVIITADAQSWIELGTGHQCANNPFRYQFWGYGYNGDWFSYGTRTSDGSKHQFRIERDRNVRWYWFIDGTQKGFVDWAVEGVRVETGLESYYEYGWHSAYSTSFLQWRRPADYAWVGWAGRDGRVVHAGMCGRWASDTDWRAGQNSTSC